MKVIRKIGVAVLALVLGIIVGLGGLWGAQTARYMNRGFNLYKAANWALDDVMRFEDSTRLVDGLLQIVGPDQIDLEWYPMANANITWDLLWKKP